MKTFKTVDYVGQIILLIVAVFIALIDGFDILGGPAIGMYFVVGGWQVISVIIHLFFARAYKIPLRATYHALLIFTLAIGGILLAIDSENIIGYLVGMLFWSPLMAILYLVCCYKETKKLSVGVIEAGQEMKPSPNQQS